MQAFMKSPVVVMKAHAYIGHSSNQAMLVGINSHVSTEMGCDRDRFATLFLGEKAVVEMPPPACSCAGIFEASEQFQRGFIVFAKSQH